MELKHQTPEQLAARFRQAYADAQGDRAVRLAGWLLAALDAGDLDDDTVARAFGGNQANYRAMLARMRVLRDAADVVRGAKGE